MTSRRIIAALCAGVLSIGVSADVWQETVAGQLQFIAASNIGASCFSNSQPSYRNYPLRGHQQFNRVGFDAGRFTFSSETAPSVQIAPLMDPVSTAGSQQAAVWSAQPAVPLKGQTAWTLYWQEPAAAMIRAARVTLTPVQWQPEWDVSYRPSASSWLSRQLLPLRLADTPARQWLVLPGDSQVPIRLIDSGSGTPGQLSIPATPGEFAILPQSADLDLDGVVERLYLLSQQGALWQYQWLHDTGWQPSLVADLSGSGWEFSGSLQRFAARWQSGRGWQQGEVFVILARAGADYRLLVLRRSAGTQTLLTFADVTAAPDLAKAGWYVALDAAPVSQAKVLGSILYVPLKAETSCATDAHYDQVAALQLYSGAATYKDAVLQLAQPHQAPLTLVNTRQQLQLWSGSDIIVPELQTLSPACLMCTEQLTFQHLQGQDTVAGFKPEQVY